MRRRVMLLSPGLAWLADPAPAQQAPSGWQPNRPMTIVVPFSPGGATDVIARLIAGAMSQSLGQPVIVENRLGGGGTVGSAAVARAASDGHTLLMGTIATHAIIPSLFAQMPYDATADFTALSQTASQMYVLVVHPSMPAHTVQELVALAKRQPDQLNYASAGNGTAGHLFAAMFCGLAGIDMVHVPYRGASPAMSDLLGGQVTVTFDVLLTTADHIREGRLRALAVTAAHRSLALPDVPTLAESGFSHFDAVGWNGLFLHAHTPAAVVARLAQEVRAALHRPDVKAQVERQGAEVVGSSPEAFARFVRAEIVRWAEVVHHHGIKVE